MTKIIKCDCKNEYQDEKYGKDQRVHNKTSGKDGRNWRCTVCKKEKP